MTTHQWRRNQAATHTSARAPRFLKAGLAWRLQASACERPRLADKPSYRFDIREIHGRIPAPDRKHLKLRMTVITRGVTRLEVHIQDRPQITASVSAGETTTTLDVPLPSEFVPFKLQLKGFVFAAGKWVVAASRKRKLSTADRRILQAGAAGTSG